ASLKAHMDSFLDDYDSQMEKLALNQIQIPSWMPEFPDIDSDLRQFIWDLKIPRARAPHDHLPDMLLHDLGRFQDNKELRERLQMLLGTNTHKVFVNTAGSGKTRMILENLCTHWGIYLTCHEESRVGSSDLQIAISTTKEQKEYFEARFQETDPTSLRFSSEGKYFNRILEANQQIVAYDLLIVILARLYILRRFTAILRKIGKDTSQMSHKRQWLYLQLHPELIPSGKSRDIFIELIKHITGFFMQEGLVSVSTDIRIEIMNHLLENVLSDIECTLGARNPGEKCTLYVAVDECQFIAQLKPHSNFFRSDNWTVERPLLRQIARSLDMMFNMKSHTTGIQACFIFTGTGLSREIIYEALSSVILKPGFTVDINETGAFNDATAQLEYMQEFFPPKIYQNKEFEQLRGRIFYWLRGRHRFTAEYLSVVLQNGYQHLHKILNSYILKMTGINPADYKGNETPFQNIAWPSRAFAFQRLEGEMKERIRTICHEYLFTSRLSADLGKNEIKFVEYGLARFNSSPDPLQQDVIVIDEPLVLLACSMWFNNQPQQSGTSVYQTLASRIRDHNPSTGRNGFEEFICFYLQHVFRQPRKLNEVFNFKGEDQIGDKLATLVTLHINDDGEERRLIEGKINLVGRPSLFGPIGQTTEHLWEEGTSSLQDWIELKNYTAFCFPMNDMGPDIMCFLKLQDPVASTNDFTYICLAIQCKFYDDLPPKTLREAVATVTPDFFFQRRVTVAAQATHDNKREIARDYFLKTLLHFPHKDPLAGKYGVLRIIAGFPVLVDLERAFDHTPDPDGSGGHPLASLNTSLLISETRQFHPTMILEVIRRRAYIEEHSLVFDLNSPGVLGIIDISKSKPSHPTKPKIRKAEAARKLAALRRNANVVRISDLSVRKDRIVPRITENIISMLQVDHARWGEKLELKRKHE
ncbi:hypothetical protein F5877DRAFT_53150, partial [Lentinula edodes]